MLSAEVLELGTIGTSLFRERHQMLGTLEVTVVIGGDICDEVGRLSWTDPR